MKTFLLSIILLTLVTVSKAQLTNTKWTGAMYIPTNVQVTLSFKQDTVDMIINENDYVGETMSYTVKDSVITLKKLSGNSPCGNDTFTVKYLIKDNKLFIKPLTDPCDDRTHAWPQTGFTKVVN